ncbi:tRNA1(Val) (adenine(37)-N6)-methyltransferase [Oceanisphaera arctica]|uniref:tRNA1(Val) (adenine(37)-N6)-methyltransferase n=1 Tax=Oceanisphaera arctica TaxID=641510 RepID=A0A2P5TP87_9GAMM|nr:methyltransferase [Oceanisphaera arctica]PPL17425.1 tRNA (adenosine(37)-N6)-methyltransferase TrmM [Oceanisphaera arctica]GHA08130.1 tRNA1(Val) (adenine(37)-N6)-methyltransferase [Oceanisphaera arctica]
MSSRGFTFKQFHINHDHCAMKVGTDGILLGAWAPIGSARRILDVGTGSGLVALMLAQRSDPDVKIVGLELDEAAAAQAEENALASPWPDKVSIERGALQQYSAPAFDLIVSNPPYFQHGQDFDCAARAGARHTVSLSLAELFGHGRRLLADDGGLAVVLPVQALAEVTKLADSNGFVLYEKRDVITREGKDPVRFLMFFSRVKHCKLMDEIVINTKNNVHGDTYVRLVAPFYLKM